MNFRRLKAVRQKELLHIVRDARSLTLALALPLMMLLLFGYALTLDVDRIPTYVYDQDQTPESRELIDQFRGSRYFQIREAINDYQAIERGIDRSTDPAQPRGAHDLLAHICWRARKPTCRLLVDGSDSNTASIALGYAEAVVAELRRATALRRAGAAWAASRSEIPVDAAHARLVQQRSEIEELHRARADRRHP